MVHVHDPRVGWSVHASQVLRIVSLAEWLAERGAPAVDVLAAFGSAPSSRLDPRRVVVVRGAGEREIAVLAAGPIDVGDVEASDVLALPAALVGSVPEISAILVARDKSLSLLLELSALTTPEVTVPGEELCPTRL
jgi:chemotaxis signal transduction protein